MNPRDHDQFWSRYDREVRPILERTCGGASRSLSDSTMDIDDMVAWIDTKVWRMLENDASPTFHDDPSVDIAIDRLTTHAQTLARWAYLALCRKHFKRINRRNEYMYTMSRAERLSMVSSVDTKLENRSDMDEKLAKLKSALSATDKQKLAASYSDPSERRRIALVLGATRREDDSMITKANGGAIKENTIQQMRSRARKRAQEVLRDSSKLPITLIAMCIAGSIALTPSSAIAGEQSGGRKGNMTPPSASVSPDLGPISEGEQSGGRKPG